MEKFIHQDIYFIWQDQRLILGNSSFQRVIDWSQGMPKTLSMECCGEIIAVENPGFDFRVAGFPAPGHPTVRCDYQVQNITFDLLNSPDGDGAVFTVETFEKERELALKLSYIVYLQLPVMAVESEICSAVIPLLYWHERQRGKDYSGNGRTNGQWTITDTLQLNKFQAVRSVEFLMRTDYYDEPVLEHSVKKDADVYGNILIAENSDKMQFFFLQEAPPSIERRGNEPGDFLIDGALICSLGSGIMPDDIMPQRLLRTNRTVCGISGNGDAADLIKKYMRCRQASASEVYGSITVNPWGCGRFPQLVNEEFLKAEVTAAGKLHADTYQIDDGYQHGGLADLIIHNRKVDREYWMTRKDLLPEGFQPLIELAKAHDLKLSLWFAPSMNQAYCDWSESCDILLEHWHNNNFESFKLDGVIFNSYTAEENFGKLLKNLHDRSNGAITVNLDVTNGTRGGLWKFAEYGLIFLENRYCCHSWPKHPYHPGNTLDNVWNLAKYCRIQNLQIEIPDPDNINLECYRERSLALPTDYDFAYWAMVPLFASPLLWLSPSLLSEERAGVLRRIMDLQKKYRSYWRDSIIKPIGSRPDGKSVCGLYADSGYLLVFREKAAAASAVLDLPEFKSAEVLYVTSGKAALNKAGEISMSEPGSAALLRLS